MPGRITHLLVAEHREIDALLERAVANPRRFDHAAFEAFRALLLRHIAIEEKVLLSDARRRRGGEPLALAPRLRLEHGALASLLVPTPDAALVAELRAFLAQHGALEEGPSGVYAECELLAGPEADSLVAQARAMPPVALAPHFDGPGTYRRAAEAIEAIEQFRSRRTVKNGG